MLYVITGLSGAGRSTALHGLEDAGFFCTDNLPVTMLAHWAENMIRNECQAAVGIDIRSTENPELLAQSLASVRAGLPWKIIFIDAEDKVLQRRYSTLKRRHPYAPNMDLTDAIKAERQALLSLREQADVVFNSSRLTPYQLSDLVESFWQKQQQPLVEKKQLTCSLVSFSYQRGLPAGADMVLDMRFLDNPHYQPELAQLTGKDEAVKAFFAEREDVAQAQAKIQDWLSFIWPKLIKERKRYFTLAFGCSGGRHRSVFMAEQIAAWMHQEDMCQPIVRHREIGDIQ